MDWFPLDVNDWLLDLATMPLDAQGAYLRLLCYQWRDGSVPADEETLAGLVGLVARSPAWRGVWGALERHFPASEGARRNPRLAAERGAAVEKSELYQTSARRREARRREHNREHNCATTVAQPCAQPEHNRGTTGAQSLHDARLTSSSIEEDYPGDECSNHDRPESSATRTVHREEDENRVSQPRKSIYQGARADEREAADELLEAWSSYRRAYRAEAKLPPERPLARGSNLDAAVRLLRRRTLPELLAVIDYLQGADGLAWLRANVRSLPALEKRLDEIENRRGEAGRRARAGADAVDAAVALEARGR